MFDDIVIRRYKPSSAQAWCTKGRHCTTQASLPNTLVGYWPLDGALLWLLV
jgi:hypothetical protein